MGADVEPVNTLAAIELSDVEKHVLALVNRDSRSMRAEDILRRWRWYGDDDTPPEPAVEEVMAAMVVLCSHDLAEWFVPPRDVRDPAASPTGDLAARIRTKDRWAAMLRR